jgi:hypothetical protein
VAAGCDPPPDFMGLVMHKCQDILWVLPGHTTLTRFVVRDGHVSAVILGPFGDQCALTVRMLGVDMLGVDKDASCLMMQASIFRRIRSLFSSQYPGLKTSLHVICPKCQNISPLHGSCLKQVDKWGMIPCFHETDAFIDVRGLLS